MSTLNPFTVNMDTADVPSNVPDPVTGGVYRYNDGVWYECLGKSTPGHFSQVYFHFRATVFDNPAVNPPQLHKWLTAQDWQRQHAQWTGYAPAALSPRASVRTRSTTRSARTTPPPR